MFPGLEVSVDHSPAVGIGHRVADVEEAPKEVAEPDRQLARRRLLCDRPVVAGDGLLERVAAEEPHGIVRTTGGVLAPEPADGDDSRVLELARDLGLADEPGADLDRVGVVLLDLLEGDLPAQLLVDREGDQPQTPAGSW